MTNIPNIAEGNFSPSLLIIRGVFLLGGKIKKGKNLVIIVPIMTIPIVVICST